MLAPQTHSGSKLDKELEQGLKLMCSHPFGVGGGAGDIVRDQRDNAERTRRSESKCAGKEGQQSLTLLQPSLLQSTKEATNQSFVRIFIDQLQIYIIIIIIIHTPL